MPNRLADATSPYLLQHKDNPVDWHEWGDEAFAEARTRDVPILLSVGYAACHWCHVMAHESFEDPEVAEVMNDLFVNVKVDREERPDIDSIYMEAVQAMTGRGGWPMTVWIDHRGQPFFAGTYFPSRPHHGMASFRQVLAAVSTAWLENRDQVADQAGRLTEAISREIPPSEAPDETGIEQAYRKIASSYDRAHGGFGQAPKFPQQPVLEFLLRVRGEAWAADADEMVVGTLGAMARGGIHDQVGGGFARYAVDGHWLVPHFEKMLYDNAQLARLFYWAGVENERPDFVAVARSTLDYMMRDLRHPEGGFFSSEDADSEGVEGRFYLWTRAEIEEVLGDEFEEVAEYFGVTDDGNFEGSNILSVVGSAEPADLAISLERLRRARSQRVRPGLDDKIISSWNGLAIRALAEVGAALGDERYVDLGRAAAAFVRDELIVDGILMRSWREGRVSSPGFVDDNAGVAVGLYALYSASGEESWYELADELVQGLTRFARPEGGFYTTDSDRLVKRPVDLTDNPLPSGNALAAEALLVGSLLSGNREWRELAEGALRAAGVLMERFPSMVTHHLSLLHSSWRARELAIVGTDWQQMARVFWSRFRPETVLAVSADGSAGVPLLEGRASGQGTLAYVCRDFVCDLPTSDPGELNRQLGP